MFEQRMLMEKISLQWKIVDCLPDDTVSCGGSHVEITSTGADDTMSCPYDSIEPWDYCVGDIIAGTDGCTEYDTDETAKFTCG